MRASIDALFFALELPNVAIMLYCCFIHQRGQSIMDDKFYQHKLIEIDQLVEFEYNTRTHSEEQINDIAQSIKTNGFYNPIIINDKNIILAGHGRLLALRQLDYKKIPCIIVTGLNEFEQEKLNIGDNKHAENAGWDYDLLADRFTFLTDNGYALDGMGYDESEIDEILNGWNSDIEIPDNVPDDTFCKFKITGLILDADGIESTLNKALQECGIEGVTIEKL